MKSPDALERATGTTMVHCKPALVENVAAHGDKETLIPSLATLMLGESFNILTFPTFYIYYVFWHCFVVKSFVDEQNLYSKNDVRFGQSFQNSTQTIQKCEFFLPISQLAFFWLLC